MICRFSTGIRVILAATVALLLFGLSGCSEPMSTKAQATPGKSPEVDKIKDLKKAYWDRHDYRLQVVNKVPSAAPEAAKIDKADRLATDAAIKKVALELLKAGPPTTK